ncbi:MAG: DNA polymerase I [Candidatus Hinthialibacter antarcticus]|nr:DNA polymerase I [Candidatus Hinthialibacter antarcticus]
MSKVFLVDGSSVFFRSFHAIRDLRRSDGAPTNAVYGYVMTLRNLLSEHNPDSVVVAFDLPGPTYRVEMYPDYKANREAPPEDLVAQIPLIKDVTKLMGLNQVEAEGFEADDLLGAMAVWLKEHGRESVIVSGDKDLMQLVNDNVSMLRLTPMKNQPNKIYNPADVKERYGVEPEQLVQVFALMGDSIDNIPGVAGIGEKTAVSLIQEFGDLETLYDNLDKVKGKKRVENLINDKEKAFLSRDLFRIDQTPPTKFDDELFNFQTIDRDALHQFFTEMEFRTFAKEYAPELAKESPADLDYQTVDTLDGLKAVVEAVKKNGACAVDTETTSLEVLDAKIVGLAFSIGPQQGWYIPLRHDQGTNLDLESARPLLKEILENPSVRLFAHHFKYDYHILRNEGFNIANLAGDTLVASYLAQTDRQSHKLDALAETLAGMRMTPITALIGEGKEQKSMTEVEIEIASPYACEDVDACWRLNQWFEPQLEKEGMTRLYGEIEVPLIRALAEMERRGVCVDPHVLEGQSNELAGEMHVLEERIFESVGKRFNLNSPSQLAEILYDDLRLLKGRKRTTRADVLEKLAAEGVEVAQDILDYRHRQKIKSTYLDSLAKLIRPDTGRVHTTFNQAVVNTGRISSSDPNLQNIPIRTDLGRRVRRAFVAKAGWQLASLDYSQIELRILAHRSKDPGLLSAFAAGEDIHRRTAADVFSVGLDDVTSDMRRKAKEINFGLNYGMSSYGLARRLKISDEEAATYIETYFSRYPLVQRYMDETVEFAQQHLYVETIFGRRVPTSGVRDANRMRRDNARRAAINGPIQGSAADLLKLAMVHVYQEFKDRADEVALLMTVHDELVLEAREDIVDEVTQRCRELMESAMSFDVPIPVECSIGPDWAALK